MTIFYLYKDLQLDYTCHPSAAGMLDAFSKAGCVPITESDFVNGKISVSSEDTIVVYISIKSEEAHAKLRQIACKKILQSLDESKSDQRLFATQIEFCKLHNIDTMINAFPSQRNIDFLSSHGIKTITMPFCGLPRNASYSNKDIDILVSGQIDDVYYPIRGKIFRAFREKGIKFLYLPHCGMSAVNSSHPYHGEKFYELLDRCWTAVTCRAGSFRDRLVPKYIEFGFSKVLPIGDAPSYMLSEMKNSMIEVNEHDTSNDISKNVIDALSNKSLLIDRIEKYHDCVSSNYNFYKNADRTVCMIRDNIFDTTP